MIKQRSRYAIKQLKYVLGIGLMLLSACTTLTKVMPGPTPTLTQEQCIIAAAGKRFGSNFFFDRDDCVQAVDVRREMKHCTFPVGIESITKPEWRKLFPETDFYLVDFRSYRSFEMLLPHEAQESSVSRSVLGWQDEQAYRSGTFDQLLEINGVVITDTNREVVARAFALMSIPSYLGREVRFLEWHAVDPETYRHEYSHYLRAWTEIWGCEVEWYFLFKNQQLSTVSRLGGSCYLSEHGTYIEDLKHFETDCEGTPRLIPSRFKDYDFNR